MSRLFRVLLSALLLILCCCSCQSAAPDSAYRLYFPVDSDVQYGSALGTQPFDPESCTSSSHSEEQPCPTPTCLLSTLLAGPTQEGLVTPFSKGVTLKSCTWESDQPGRLLVTLSEQYSGLADISLTLADYCIVLTLSQLEGVESVEIRTLGYSASYRSHTVLTSGEALLEQRLPNAS